MPGSFDMNSFNALISQASQVIMCDSTCQKQKQAEKLKQNVINAQATIASAPSQLKDAQQKYTAFTEGASAANNLLQTQFQAEADKIVAVFNTIFNEEVRDINSQINSYNSLLTNFNNVVELHSKYIDENNELSESLKEDTSDILTNKRKTYYQDQGINSLKYYYYYFFLLIYVILVICFFVFSFWYPSLYSWKSRLAIFISLILLPVFSTWILGFIIYLIYQIYELLPKNVRFYFSSRKNFLY